MLLRFVALYLFLFALTGTVCRAGDSSVSADFNDDGVINLLDYSILTDAWQDFLPWIQVTQKRVYGHWRFDRGEGAVAWDTIHGNHGTLVGDVSWQNGKLGSALHFANHGHVVVDKKFNQHSITKSITLAAWIKTSAQGNWPTIISKGDNSWRLCLRGNTGMLHFGVAGVTVQGTEPASERDFVNGTIVVNDGQWHHVAGVYDEQAGVARIYVDGVIDVERVASGAISTNGCEVWIGGNCDYMDTERSWWDGLIDDVRVCSYALRLPELNRKEYFVSNNGGSNYNDGLSESSAFETIQYGIDIADPNDCVYVCPGRYAEQIYIDKPITLASCSDAAILESPGDFAITLSGVQSDCVIKNLVITNSDIGLFLVSSSPVIDHLTVTANVSGLEAYAGSYPAVSHCIFWDNDHDLYYEMPMASEARYSCVQSGAAGQGNISGDPLFGDPNSGDFHLRSEIGRYLPGVSDVWNADTWIKDNQTSPCIDIGDPMDDPWRENRVGGGYLNMGSYGDTPYAAMSQWALEGDCNYDGYVDMCDLVKLSRNWLKMVSN